MGDTQGRMEDKTLLVLVAETSNIAYANVRDR